MVKLSYFETSVRVNVEQMWFHQSLASLIMKQIN